MLFSESSNFKFNKLRKRLIRSLLVFLIFSFFSFLFFIITYQILKNKENPGIATVSFLNFFTSYWSLTTNFWYILFTYPDFFSYYFTSYDAQSIGLLIGNIIAFMIGLTFILTFTVGSITLIIIYIINIKKSYDKSNTKLIIVYLVLTLLSVFFGIFLFISQAAPNANNYVPGLLAFFMNLFILIIYVAKILIIKFVEKKHEINQSSIIEQTMTQMI